MKKYGLKSAMITFITKEKTECTTLEKYKKEYKDGLSFLDDLESFVHRLKVISFWSNVWQRLTQDSSLMRVKNKLLSF